MADLEKVKRAKMFLDRMSHGINPVSGLPVLPGDCVCRKEVSNCLRYVSGLLDEIIGDKGPAEGGSGQSAKQKKIKSGTLSKQVTVGSRVKLVDQQTGELMILELLPAHESTVYKTMGYKTKKYSEVLQTSDADGVTSVSVISPLGKALLGKREGEVASCAVKGKTMIYRLLEIIS